MAGREGVVSFFAVTKATFGGIDKGRRAIAETGRAKGQHPPTSDQIKCINLPAINVALRVDNRISSIREAERLYLRELP